MFMMPSGITPESTIEKQTVQSADLDNGAFAEELNRAQSADEKASASGQTETAASIFALLGMQPSQHNNTNFGIAASGRQASKGETTFIALPRGLSGTVTTASGA